MTDTGAFVKRPGLLVSLKHMEKQREHHEVYLLHTLLTLGQIQIWSSFGSVSFQSYQTVPLHGYHY